MFKPFLFAMFPATAQHAFRGVPGIVSLGILLLVRAAAISSYVNATVQLFEEQTRRHS
jgi:hypothetical protein